MFTSEATTRSVTVYVESRFVPERSEPQNRRFLFAYRVRIANHGSDTVQLISRHWRITDATGHTEEVRGPGVVGQQPVLESGSSFEYTSYCPLSTPFGTMTGSYQMVTPDGMAFDAEIAPFELSLPLAVN